MSNRWYSWGATAPLWGTGAILIVLGVALILAARGQVRHGSR